MNQMKKYGVPLLGPFLFLLFLNLELGLSEDQSTFLAIFVFVVYNWLIAAIPLFVTGLIGVALSSLMGVANPEAALASFANPVIFLFLAGFLFARSMSQNGLDKRLSLLILKQKFVGNSFNRLLFTLFFITAFFSMWVSNTATTAMMLPIVLGVARSLDIKDDKTVSYMLLGLAYSSSVGGLGSPVGSPPNVIAIGMLKELADVYISFAEWTLFGAPLAFVFLLAIFFYVKKRIPFDQKEIDTSFIEAEAQKLLPISSAEKTLMSLFSLLLACWFLPGLLNGVWGDSFPFFALLDKRMDPGVAGILIASALFVFPFYSKNKLLEPADIKEIDWGSLLLFGSGLALGKILFSVGLAQLAGSFIVENVAGSSFFLLILVLSYFTIFSTELASNTASANILIPIIIAAAGALGVTPALPTIAVAISCSLAFMLPVATPPNAIVYGSGKVDMPTMIKFGFFLNLLFGIFIAIIFYFLNFFI